MTLHDARREGLAPALAVCCLVLGATEASAQTPIDVPAQIITGSSADNPQFHSAACGGGMDCRLAQPFKVASDSAGNIIIADTNNRLVKVFDESGLTLIGLYGLNDGSNIGNPPGLPGSPCAIYPRNADGFPVASPGIELTRTDCFSYPSGVAVDSKDRIYVTDAGNHRVMVFCPVANTTAQPGAAALPGCPVATSAPPMPAALQFITAFGQFGGPVVDASNNLTGAIGGDGQFDYPFDVVVDKNTGGTRVTDRVYVLDSLNDRVQAFDLSSTSPYTYRFVSKFGSRGTGPGQFAEPQGLAIDQISGNLIVSEYNNNFVDIFTAAGAYVRSLGDGYGGSGVEEFSTPTDAAVDSQQRIWVVDSDNGRLQVYDFTGAWLFERAAPDSDLALYYPYGVEADDARGRLLVADTGADRIEVWRPAALADSGGIAAANPAVGTSFSATVAITNVGTVALDDVVPVVTTAAGLNLLSVGQAIPPPGWTGSLAPDAPPAIFTVPIALLAPGAVTLSMSASGLHTRSGNSIDAANGGSQTSTLSFTVGAANEPAISAVGVTPSSSKVLVGTTFTVTVTIVNAGNASLSSPQIVINASGPVTPATATLAARGSLRVGGTQTFTQTYTASPTTGVITFSVVASASVPSTGSTVTSPSATVTVHVASDVTPPSTSLTIIGLGRPDHPTPQPAANAAGFFRQPVRATWTATDNDGGTGVAKICFAYKPLQTPTCVPSTATPSSFQTSRNFGLDGPYPITYYSIDAAGNQETPKSLMLKIDQTAPTILLGQPSPPANANGWNNTPVTIPVSVIDNFSGVQSATLGHTPLTGGANTSVIISVEGQGIEARVVATDLAGNTTLPAVSPIVNIDMTPPTIRAVVVDGVATFPPASTAFPNGVGDPAPPPTTVPGITVAAYRGSDLDPATVPPASGISVTGNSASWTLCDRAGNCATTSAPSAELVNQFDVASRDDAMFAQFGASGPAATPLPRAISESKNGSTELRTYSVLQGGNGVTLVERVQSGGGKEVHVDVLSFLYVRGCPAACAVVQGTVPPGTTKKFEWAEDKDGSLKMLEQKMTIGRGPGLIHVQGHYDAKTNQTAIDVRASQDLHVTLSGLVLLQMATKDGQLVIRYNGVTVQ